MFAFCTKTIEMNGKSYRRAEYEPIDRVPVTKGIIFFGVWRFVSNKLNRLIIINIVNWTTIRWQIFDLFFNRHYEWAKMYRWRKKNNNMNWECSASESSNQNPLTKRRESGEVVYTNTLWPLKLRVFIYRQ